MTSTHRNARQNSPLLAAARPAATRPAAMLTLLAEQRTMDLARLTKAISTDFGLCRQITEAACQEFDSPRLSLEQAIVLLGRDRLVGHLLNPRPPRRKPVASAWRRPHPLFGEAE